MVEPDAPPPLRGKGQTPAPKPSPKPSKVAKVAAAQPPHEALDVEALGASVPTHVPFVNRPFESEIHGTVNFTQFCFVLLVTWCYRVLLSCYLRSK